VTFSFAFFMCCMCGKPGGCQHQRFPAECNGFWTASRNSNLNW
jgi:hypothetical protein